MRLGCIMYKVNIINWSNFTNEIDENDLGSKGFEKEPHITVLYGLELGKTSIKSIVAFVNENFKKIIVDISDIEVFENDTEDVLVLNINSKELIKYNKLLRDNFDYFNTRPDYVPHLTLAYLKKGTGIKYKNKLKTKGRLKLNQVMYSDSNFKYLIKLIK